MKISLVSLANPLLSLRNNILLNNHLVGISLSHSDNSKIILNNILGSEVGIFYDYQTINTLTLLNTVIFNILDIHITEILPFNINNNSYNYNIYNKSSPSGMCSVIFNNKYFNDIFELVTK